MTYKKITRKDFLKRGGAGLGSLLLQAALPTRRGARTSTCLAVTARTISPPSPQFSVRRDL